MTALGDLDTKVYNTLYREKFLEPDVRVHPQFNSLDCTTILQSALTRVKKVLQQKQLLDDKTHQGERKTPEAGAEVGAMMSEVDKKRLRQIDACVCQSAKNRDLPTNKKRQLRSHAEAKLMKVDDFQELN